MIKHKLADVCFIKVQSNNKNTKASVETPLIESIHDNKKKLRAENTKLKAYKNKIN